MKKPESLLKEYASRLSDDNLKFLTGRLTQRLGEDLPEVLNFYSTTLDLDRWLSSAKNSTELYDMIDFTHTYIEKEYAKRFDGPVGAYK
jgi:hypothetical protein